MKVIKTIFLSVIMAMALAGCGGAADQGFELVEKTTISIDAFEFSNDDDETTTAAAVTETAPVTTETETTTEETTTAEETTTTEETTEAVRYNMVFFGDSDTAGYLLENAQERFSALTAKEMEMNELNGAEAGAGFCTADKKILDQVNGAVSSMTDEEKEKTEYVIILAGAEDYSEREKYGLTEDIESEAVSAVLKLCLDTFPNARICFGFGIKGTSADTQYDEWQNSIDKFIEEKYPKVSVFKGYGSNIPADTAYRAADGIHLNGEGHRLAAEWLVEQIQK